MSGARFTGAQLLKYKEALLTERNRTESDRLAYIRDERGESEESAPGELSDFDPNEPADQATNLFDRERSHAAEQNMTRIMAKIDRALAKIADGTYGLSDIDGSPIPLPRLEAIPYALTTIEQEEAY